MRKPIIAVDFDGTITQKSDFPFICSTPNNNVISFLKNAKKYGAIIILWTCRENKYLEEAVEYCKKYKVPIDLVNEHADYVDINSRKIYADYYIDDKSSGSISGMALDFILNEIKRGNYSDWIKTNEENENGR